MAINNSNYCNIGIAVSGGNRPGFDYTKYPMNPLGQWYYCNWCGIQKAAAIQVEEDFIIYTPLAKTAGASLEIYKFVMT